MSLLSAPKSTPVSPTFKQSGSVEDAHIHRVANSISNSLLSLLPTILHASSGSDSEMVCVCLGQV